MDAIFKIFSIEPTKLSLIKQGGQKTVYLYDHEKYGKTVIKVGSFQNDSGLERIIREIEFLKNPSNREFLIIEEYIKSIGYEEVRKYYCNEEKVIMLLKLLIEALSIMWDKNTIHRDLKPDNILFTGNFDPKIIDLGIARFLDFSSLTQTLAMRGPCTPIYAAPEQLSNKKNLIDLRTDFFALGIIILEILYKFHPFDGIKVENGQSIPINILNGNYVKPTEHMGFSQNFCQLIIQLLQVQQFKRFKNKNVLNEFLTKHW